MSFTSFPIETTNPKTDIILPVGTHVFRLTVKDDAGMVSQPDTVTIVVKQVGEPTISQLDPPEGRRGHTVNAVIHGTNLHGAETVAVYRDAIKDDRISVTVEPGGTAETLPIALRISHRAALGGRTLELVTSHGTATVGFQVIPHELPIILGIAPTFAAPTWLAPLPARVEGEHFEHTRAVTFFMGTKVDPAISAVVRRGTEEYLDVDLSVSANAEYGRRRFAVTTAAGTTESPNTVTFTVVPGYLSLAVMALTIITAFIHISLNFPSAIFILNGLGYLALLFGLYAPTEGYLTAYRPWIRWALLGYTVVTIIAWLLSGGTPTPLGYITKAIELMLVILLFTESRRP